MIKLVLILITVFSINALCNYSDYTTTKISDYENSISKDDGDKAPDFQLKSFEGKTIKLSDYKGKVIIIDFWATWCSPCRKGIPDLISIQKDFSNDVVIIGISLDGEQTIKSVPDFVKSYGINYPIVYGDEKVVAAYGGIEGIPTAFVIDKNGNVVDKHVGLVDKSIYINKIKELLK